MNIVEKQSMPVNLGDSDTLEITLEKAPENAVQKIVLSFSQRDLPLLRKVNSFQHMPRWKRLLLAWNGKIS